MKNKSRIRVKILLPILMLGIASIAFSCNTKTKAEDTKVVAEQMNEEKFNTADSKDDAQFLVNAAEMHTQGFKLGQLAQVNGSSADIKDHAKKMEVFHDKSLSSLTNLASEKAITIPMGLTENGQKNYDDFSALKGLAFDEDYNLFMLEHHTNAIKAFETAAMDTDDADIKEWASDQLSELRKHLEQSLKLQKSID